MTNFVAVDPSIAKTGWAVVKDSEIVDVGAIETDLSQTDSQRVASIASGLREVFEPGMGLVIENQRWRGKKEKNPPALLKLVRALGAAEGACEWAWIHAHLPQHWKGQQDKDEHHKYKVLPKLDENIIMSVRSLPKRVQGDALDACGLSLFEVEHGQEGRATTKRTASRHRRYRRGVKKARRARKAHKRKKKDDAE